jgi:hypothetical protein
MADAVWFVLGMMWVSGELAVVGVASVAACIVGVLAVVIADSGL